MTMLLSSEWIGEGIIQGGEQLLEVSGLKHRVKAIYRQASAKYFKCVSFPLVNFTHFFRHTAHLAE